MCLFLPRCALKPQVNIARGPSRTSVYIPSQICSDSLRKQTKRSFKYSCSDLCVYVHPQICVNRPRDPSRGLCVYSSLDMYSKLWETDQESLEICIKGLRKQTKKAFKDLCVYIPPCNSSKSFKEIDQEILQGLMCTFLIRYALKDSHACIGFSSDMYLKLLYLEL